MYLVLARVATPGLRITAQELRRALHAGAAGTDRLEHDLVDVRQDLVTFALYLRAVDLVDAERRAEQLCSRVVAAVARPHSWRLLSVRAL